jgi:Spy/CpxP family protein refolding chaperone
MKPKFVTLPLLGFFALGTWVLANDPAPAGDNDWRGRGGGRHQSLDRITDQLNLTPDQKAKIQPIIDQAQPQLETIHREAMEKARKVMEDAIAQMRPMLTPEQQKKLDEAKTDRREGHGRRHRQGEGAPDDSDDS